MRITFRQLDRGLSCDVNKTKTISHHQYVQLYSGPIYYMHFKYGTMLTIVFVTLMYGAAMPVLIVYGFGGIFCLYVVERHMLYYGYQTPPMYDEKLNNLALDIIQKAPLLCLPFSFWFFGNLQMMQESYMTITNASDPMYTGHVW